MGGYIIYGATKTAHEQIFSLNLPGRNLFLNFLKFLDDYETLDKATLCWCSEKACYVADEEKFMEVLEKAGSYLHEHPDWVEPRTASLYGETDHGKVALEMFEALRKVVLDCGFTYIVFYDNLEVHSCEWPEEFSFLPARLDFIHDMKKPRGGRLSS